MRGILFAMTAFFACTNLTSAGPNDPNDFENGPYAPQNRSHQPKRGQQPVHPEEINGAAKPQFYSSCEFFYALDRYREANGLPPMMEDYHLHYAAYLLALEMAYWDYPALPLPDGKDLNWALKKAGYRGNPEQVRVFYEDFDYRGILRVARNRSVPPVLRDVQKEETVAFGVGIETVSLSSGPSLDGQGVAERRMNGGGVRVILISNSQPERLGRLTDLIANGVLWRKSQRVKDSYEVEVNLKIGRPLKNVAILGDHRFLKSRLRISTKPPYLRQQIIGNKVVFSEVVSDPAPGGVPVGIAIDRRNGVITGTPVRRGDYRLRIRASYRVPANHKPSLISTNAFRGRRTCDYRIVVR